MNGDEMFKFDHKSFDQFPFYLYKMVYVTKSFGFKRAQNMFSMHKFSAKNLLQFKLETFGTAFYKFFINITDNFFILSLWCS